MTQRSPMAPIYIEPAELALDEKDLTQDERTALDTINARVAAGESLDDIITFVFQETSEIFPCDRLSVAFLQDDESRVVSNTTHALYEPVLLKKDYAEDLQGSSLAAVLKTGRLRILNDLEAYLARKPDSGSTKLLVQEGVRSSLTCPIVVDGRRVGFFFRSSRKPGSYGRREAMLHQAMADRLSQAIEKAYRIQQLEETNRAYHEMLGFASHELKSPLGSLVMDARLLTQGYLGEVSQQQEDKLNRIIGKSEYLLGLVHEYLDLARIEAGSLQAEMVEADFAVLVAEPALSVVETGAEEKGIRIASDGLTALPPITCDPHLMKVVMVNLLGNAVKYGIEQGEVRLRAEMKAQRLRVSVWNKGPGFPKGERHKLFRKFSRLADPELKKRKGTGVGLYTTWRIIQLHGGQLWADSKHGQWAEFGFEIPQPPPGPAKASTSV